MAVYRVIPVENNQLRQYRKPADVTTFLLGRRVSAYIIVKTDAAGSRVVSLENAPSFATSEIEKLLEAA